jgi:RHS repeat-associated protein
MLSAFAPWSADECISAFESEGKKPHQGVAGKNPALHQGIVWSNSTSALGLRRLGRENRSGSRCTGKERDSESGLDMFGARYYGSSLGRFMTPDWAAKPTNVPYASFGNPQSLNLYSYVSNNPCTTRDPDGHVVGVDDLLIGGTIGVMALSAYMQTPAGQQMIQNGVQALSNMTSAAGSAISSLFRSSETAPAPASAAPATGQGQQAPLPDDANVVRGGSGAPGGANSPEGIAAGIDTHPSGVTGFSAESAPGKSVGQLAAESPEVSKRGQVGCCTVGEVRAAGGDVVPTSGQSPNHATVTGLTPAQGSQLLTPTIPNPAKVKPQ